MQGTSSHSLTVQFLHVLLDIDVKSIAMVQAEGLEGSARSTHSFARVSVAGQVQLTGVRWATLRPSWAEEGLVFRDVPAAAELVAELWDVGGAPTRTKKLREQRVRARRPTL